SVLIFVALGVVLAFTAWQLIDTTPSRTELSLNRYENRLTEGKVRSATLLDKDHEIHGKLTDGTDYVVKFPEGYTDQLTGGIVGANVKLDVDGQQASAWLGLLLGC